MQPSQKDTKGRCFQQFILMIVRLATKVARLVGKSKNILKHIN